MEHSMGLLLNLSLLLPLLAAVVLWFAPLTKQQARTLALGVTLVTLLLVTIVTSGSPATDLAPGDVYAASEWNWLGGVGFAEMDDRPPSSHRLTINSTTGVRGSREMPTGRCFGSAS